MSFIVVGILFIITGPVLAIKDGVKDDSDMTMWMINQPLEKLFMIRSMMISGAGFVLIGLLTLTMPA